MHLGHVMQESWVPNDAYALCPSVGKMCAVMLARSQTDGAIWKGDLRTGEGEIVISGGQTAGLDYDRRSGYLFVCGGLTGERETTIKHMFGNVQACPASCCG